MKMKTDFPDINYYFGLDVQVNRGCAYYVLSSRLDYVASGWLSGDGPAATCQNLRKLVESLNVRSKGEIAVGIDAPRMALTAPREYYWRGGKWVPRASRDRGYGRHCEVVIRALNIAYPQWTPLVGEAPAWMELGFALFETLDDYPQVLEVFPSASYRLLEGSHSPGIQLSFEEFGPGPKDMLDAAVAAYTVYEWAAGRGSEVGGGDRMGTIVLPTRLPGQDSHPVLIWPS